MPCYVYACDTCDYTVERLEKFSDPPEPVPCNVAQAYHHAQQGGELGYDFWRLLNDDGCPGQVTRQLGSPILNFKGSGFHATDYKRK